MVTYTTIVFLTVGFWICQMVRTSPEHQKTSQAVPSGSVDNDSVLSKLSSLEQTVSSLELKVSSQQSTIQSMQEKIQEQQTDLNNQQTTITLIMPKVIINTDTIAKQRNTITQLQESLATEKKKNSLLQKSLAEVENNTITLSILVKQNMGISSFNFSDEEKNIQSIRGRLNTIDHRMEQFWNNITSKLQPAVPVPSNVNNCMNNHTTAFHAILSTAATVEVGRTIVFDHVLTNIGQAYDKNTGIFRCKIPGVYLIHYAINTRKQNFVMIKLMRNGVIVGISQAFGTTTWEVQSSASTIIQLDVGDKLYVQVQIVKTDSPISNEKLCEFSGVLIHSN